MKPLLVTVLLGSILAMGAARAAAPVPDVNDPRWGCYDPLPGHPTDTEKRAFIASVAPAAQAAENGGGPPAAGLLAMSALEFGFGWTRTAIFANNLFGWKFTGATAGGGRGDWILACQPVSDPNKRYIVFRDGQDSVAFVAGRLASFGRYAPVTQQYHVDRADGMAADAAVGRWVRGIAAAGYNPLPAYPAQVLSLANNVLHPGPKVSAEDSLYGFSIGPVVPAASEPSATPTAAASTAAVSPAPAAPPPSAAAQAAAAFLHATLRRSRYMAERCDPSAITDWPNYPGRAVVRCQYSVTAGGKTLSALVYLLNPTEENVVARIEDACRTVGSAERSSCGRQLASMIVNQNGGQFPVAGFVIERKQDAGGHGTDPVYLEFRDGCTVESVNHLNFTDRQLTVDAMEHAARAPLASTRRIARIANATRADYRRAGGTAPVGTGPGDDKQNLWPQVVRETELHAQDTGTDDLLRGVAMGMRDQLSRD